ncbi:hypothetical protein CVT25_004294 [Psilocybe cyanescens]|uniref:Serine/threonine specific protein phosphatases domain-containing protein n=1 Tax=Psilocybe cyanescens TaxID=93625 RepID=A0A409XDT1_PSICY|nr:hypothetical protein CVT25_004294 [Psilocybe cyanescens]
MRSGYCDEVAEEEGPPPSLTPEYLRGHFLQGLLTDGQALHTINTATDIFSREPDLVHIESPVTICGDICGKYARLVYMIPLGTSLNLIARNYATGGAQGIEVSPCVPLCRALPSNPCQCLLYLYALKIHNPGRIVLLRGCYESRHSSESFTFKREYTVYEAFLRSFCTLPISALVDKKLFYVHGGISPGLNTLKDIDQARSFASYINRFVEIGSYRLLCDLLCSDPFSDFDKETEPTTNSLDLASRETFIYRNMRSGKLSGSYTYEGVCQFLDLNDLLVVINGHGARTSDGYRMYRRTKKNNLSVITISSVSNYRNTPRIPGVFLIFSKEMLIRQFVSYPAANSARRIIDTRRGVIGRFMLLLKMIRCAYYLFAPCAHSD